MAKNEKENAKPNTGLPKAIPVNAGTAGSVPTPANLGVPTPALPFDPMAAMQGVAPGALPQATGPDTPPGAPGQPAPREPFAADADTVQAVQGMIFHWDKEQLKNLITYAAHLLTHAEKNSSSDATPAPDDAQQAEA